MMLRSGVAIVAVFLACAACVLEARVVSDGQHEYSYRVVATNAQSDPVQKKIEIIVNDVPRTLYVYVPSSYDPSSKESWPMLYFFHGATDACTTAENFMIAGFTKEQVTRRFLLVTPCGIDKVWKGTLDLEFTAAMLLVLSDEFRVDESRIYVSGFSNGAGLTEYLGCRIPENFAGLAIAAGWVMGDSFPPPANETQANFKLLQTCDTYFADANATVQVIKLQGSVDPAVEPYGRTAVPSTRDDFYGWALRNGCKGSPTTEFESSVYKYEQFKDCPPNVSVRLYFLYGVPHQWVVNAQFNYNQVIMDGFKLVAPAHHTGAHRGSSSSSPHHQKTKRSHRV